MADAARGLPAEAGSYSVRGLIVSPTNADRVVIAAGAGKWARGGIYRSDDGGATWRKLPQPDPALVRTFIRSQADEVAPGLLLPGREIAELDAAIGYLTANPDLTGDGDLNDANENIWAVEFGDVIRSSWPPRRFVPDAKLVRQHIAVDAQLKSARPMRGDPVARADEYAQ